MASHRTGFLRAFGALLCLLSGIGHAAAVEACSEAAIGQCFPEYSAVVALARTDNGFAAIGVQDGGFDLIRLSGDASVLARAYVANPSWMDASGASSLTIEKLVKGADGALLIVGWASTGPAQNQYQIGVIGRVDRDNNVAWSEPIGFSNETSTILYSAAYDPEGKRFIIVGRHTNGADNGKCAFWSESLLLSVPEAVVGAGFSPFFLNAAQSGPESRMALYDIKATGRPGEFVAVGFATARGDKASCQDNAMAVLVSGGANNDWNVGKPYLMGLKEANEVAFSVVSIGAGRFMLAGHGSQAGTKARAALLATFEFGQKPVMRTDPYPDDGSDNSGGDRYRILVPLGTSGSYVAAGSASASRQSSNQGIWTIVSDGLDQPGKADFLTRQAGSDIEDAALGGDGRVLAVGTHSAGDQDVGWIGFIFEQRFTAERRPPDPTLPMLTQNEEASGSAIMPEREIVAGTGFRSKGAGKGTEFEVRMSFAAETDLVAAALPSTGDLDLALIDGSGRMAAFSSNLDEAGEYLRARLAPGEYSLKVLAVSDLGEYELRLAGGPGAEDRVMAALEALDGSARSALGKLLESSGYGIAANPDIGFGGDTVRSLLAFYNTFQPATDAGGVQQFIANASLGSGAAQ
jgi:hypothetical protein